MPHYCIENLHVRQYKSEIVCNCFQFHKKPFVWIYPNYGNCNRLNQYLLPVCFGTYFDIFQFFIEYEKLIY